MRLVFVNARWNYVEIHELIRRECNLSSRAKNEIPDFENRGNQLENTESY